MSNQLNSPTSKKLSTPSSSSSTTLTRRIILLIFDPTKLLDCSKQQRQVLEETALKELEIQRDLASTIRSTKICLWILDLTEDQALQKLRELWALYEMYRMTTSVIKCFEKYLLEQYKPTMQDLRINRYAVRNEMRELIIQEQLQVVNSTEALTTLEQLMKSLTELHILPDSQETSLTPQNEST
jgi:hypothetical protein